MKTLLATEGLGYEKPLGLLWATPGRLRTT
jgi:hypothetical protein